MYINFIDFINADSKKIRNYLLTFGHIVIKGAITRQQILRLNDFYKNLFQNAYGISYHELVHGRRNLSLEPVQKHVPNWLQVMKDLHFFTIAKKAIGDDSVFCNSDASLFFQGSPVHRDQETLLPQFKINLYLQPTAKDGNGDFYVVPGSQHAGDKYADFMNHYYSWPNSGGGYVLDNLPLEPFTVDDIENLFPIKYLNINLGDILIFDDRMFHGTKSSNFLYERKLLTAVFAPNPNNFSLDYFKLIGSSIDHAKNELKELAIQGASKNAKWYYPHFYDDKYSFAHPHLEFLKEVASVDYPTIGEANVFKEQLNFNMQNRRFNLNSLLS